MAGPQKFLRVDCFKQREDSRLFAVAYQDNGQFYFEIFDCDGKQLHKMDVNRELDIDRRSTGMKVCTTPLIVTSDFTPKDTILVNLYHKKERCHYHLLYDVLMKTVLYRGKVQFDKKLNSNEMNFPVDSFFVQSKMKFLCFYRQGIMVDIDACNVERGIKVIKLMPREIDQIYFMELNVEPGNQHSEKREFFMCLYGGQIHLYDFNSLESLQKYHTVENLDSSL